jgi:hypothetical protein
MGNTSLLNNLTGNENTAIGVSALESNVAGHNNTAAGRLALFNNTGSSNVAIGFTAGLNATTGSNNIYLGTDVTGTAGESNTMYLGRVGTQMKTVIAGVRDTPVIGGEMVLVDAAGRLGSGPIATGANTVGTVQVIDNSLTASDLAPNSVGTSEVAFNYAASASEGGPASDVECVACIGSAEVSFGFATPGANSFTGTQAIHAGHLALDNSTAATGVVTKDGDPFLHNFGVSNTFLGLNAGNLSMTGNSNTAIGRTAFFNNTTGLENTAVGVFALGFNTSGDQNTASGSRALGSNTEGRLNTASGAYALSDNTTGNNNTATGWGALSQNTVGEMNTASGTHALADNVIGINNTATGSSALSMNRAHHNTAFGRSALGQNTTGSNNVALGFTAGFSATTGSFNIYLGSNVSGVAGESNTMYLGKVGTQTKTFIAGVRGITTINPDAIQVLIDSAGQLGTISSSRRFKEDIRDLGDASARLLQLRPVTFRYTQPFAGGAKPIQYGLIAEEVAEVFPDLVVTSADGQVETVQYHKLDAMFINELQRLYREVQALKAEVERLKAGRQP